MDFKKETREGLIAKLEELQKKYDSMIGDYKKISVHSERIESVYRNFIENSPRGMFFYELDENEDLIFRNSNPSADKILGIDTKQFIGMTIGEAFPPLLETEIPRHYKDAAKNGIVWSTEQVVYDDGLISGAYDLVAFQTTPGNMVVIFDDITERKKSELLLQQKSEEIKQQNQKYAQINEDLNRINKELEQEKQTSEASKEHLQLIANNLVNGMLYQVVTPNEINRRITYVSDAVETLYGCTAKEAMEDSNLIYGKIHPDDIANLVQKEQAAIKTMTIFRAEARVINPDGSTRWSYYISKPRNIDGIICWDGIEIDITDRKKAETELIQAKEKAEESDRLKTAFLQNMSHEIRTPMNAIMGFSDILMENFEDKSKLEHYSKIINQRCGDLLGIINDLLDISKIESGQLEMDIEECDLNELFTELSLFFAAYQKRINKPNISFNLLYKNCSACEHILTDRLKLKQILINLLSNAFKFTDAGTIECGAEVSEGKLLFYVSDTGIGIPTEKYDEVFGRFAQIHHPERKNLGGTGLGLSIAKGLTQLLGGDIWIEPNTSQFGEEAPRGCTFKFTIDYVRAQVEENAAFPDNPDAVKSFRNNTILIVEDDFYNAEYLKEILSDTGVTILHAEYGEEAVEIALNQQVNLVLMDIRLPDINGYTATRSILRTKPDVKVIAQTAYAAYDERKKAQEAGCIDYISKPTRRNELIALIGKYLKVESL